MQGVVLELKTIYPDKRDFGSRTSQAKSPCECASLARAICFRVSTSSGCVSLLIYKIRYFVVLTGSIVKRPGQTFRVIDAAPP